MLNMEKLNALFGEGIHWSYVPDERVSYAINEEGKFLWTQNTQIYLTGFTKQALVDVFHKAVAMAQNGDSSLKISVLTRSPEPEYTHAAGGYWYMRVSIIVAPTVYMYTDQRPTGFERNCLA